MRPPESHTAFLGTWTFPADEEFADTGLLHFAADGRAIQFVFLTKQPAQPHLTKLWYIIETAT